MYRYIYIYTYALWPCVAWRLGCGRAGGWGVLGTLLGAPGGCWVALVRFGSKFESVIPASFLESIFGINVCPRDLSGPSWAPQAVLSGWWIPWSVPTVARGVPCGPAVSVQSLQVTW